jgi:hypothetical protein
MRDADLQDGRRAVGARDAADVVVGQAGVRGPNGERPALRQLPKDRRETGEESSAFGLELLPNNSDELRLMRLKRCETDRF